MPELPEVEVVRLFLESQLLTKTIKKIEVLNSKSFIGNHDLVEGQQIVSLTRLGKQLSLHLSNQLLLLFHLKMTGQLVYIPTNNNFTVLGHPTPNLPAEALAKVGKSTRVIFTFSDNSHLFFNDQRKFGWIKLLSRSEVIEAQNKLGLDILDPLFTDDYFYHQLQNTSRPIKLAILDQNRFAGIGNIYANDALFLAYIHPLTSSKKITPAQASVLRKHLIQIMKDSILHGGSTAKDHGYVQPNGDYGQHQFHFQVYQKEGESCPCCPGQIKRIKLGGRSTFFCPSCQRLG